MFMFSYYILLFCMFLKMHALSSLATCAVVVTENGFVSIVSLLFLELHRSENNLVGTPHHRFCFRY